MKASDIPGKIVLPWGNSAGGSYIHVVPVPSQIGVTDGAASYTDGFVPLNFQDPALGGVPPFGQDFNGVLNAISAMTRWLNSGGPVPYDGTFQTAIGGYPKGAIVQSVATFGKLWVCAADDNMTNPDTGGANWLDFVTWLGIVTLINAQIAASPDAAKAWLRYDGVAKSIIASSGISSVTYNGVGDYTINFSASMGSANYTAICTVLQGASLSVVTRPGVIYPTSFNVNYLHVQTGESGDSGAVGFLRDQLISVAVLSA